MFSKFFKQLGSKGQGFVEYALMVAVVVIVIFVAARLLGTQSSVALSQSASRVVSGANA